MDTAESTCSGTLISLRHVLTAAHCFRLSSESACDDISSRRLENSDLERVSVYLYQMCRDESCTKTIKRGVNRVSIPTTFIRSGCPEKNPDDIALLELDADYNGSKFACLPMGGYQIPRFSTGFAFGKEAAAAPSSSSNMVAAIQNKQPKKFLWEKVECLSNDRKGRICMRPLNDSIACKGDSGHSPLELRPHLPPIIASVYSFGENCIETRFRTFYKKDFKVDEVFTPVRPLLPFICQETGICVPGARKSSTISPYIIERKSPDASYPLVLSSDKFV